MINCQTLFCFNNLFYYCLLKFLFILLKWSLILNRKPFKCCPVCNSCSHLEKSTINAVYDGAEQKTKSELEVPSAFFS